MEKEYDVKEVLKWKCPKGGGAPIIAMPNIPKPLHLMNPRNLLGRKTWDAMRRRCYAMANMACEICGQKLDKGMADAHELYDINYVAGTSKFVRTICLCRKCHRYGIHSGRCLTLYKHGNPLMTRDILLDGAENVFRLVHEYNKKHTKEPLRVYSTFLDYLKVDDLKEPMERLIKKYNVKFYQEHKKSMADWGDWKLIIGNKEYPTPYANEDEWEEAMAKQSKKDTSRQATNNFTGEIYDKLDEILKSS